MSWLTAPSLLAAEEGLSVSEFIVPRVLIAVAVIIVVARVMGRLFARIRQPAVVGEIAAGILLGPSLLGLLPGDLDTLLFPEAIRGYLTVVANLGLVVFMFIVGLELDFSLIKGKGKTAGMISVSSIILPFALGALLAVWLHSAHDVVMNGGQLVDVELLPFALFIGASMSVTAFPVLARILVDRGMYRVPLGVLAMSSAAVDDVLAWSLLAVVVAVVDAAGLIEVPLILLQSILFVAVLFFVVRPLLARLFKRYERTGKLTPDLLAVVVIGILACSFVTAQIGIHQIFGAFAFGAAMPRKGTHGLFREVRERLEPVSVLVLLPVFFVATGLNVDVTGLGASGVLTVVAVVLVACVGKFCGAFFGARLSGVPRRKAGALGVLMNTRGLTELVILGVGLEKGILDQQLFTALVIMAIFTTVITEPLLRRLYTDRMLAADLAEAERASLGSGASFRLLVHLDDLDRAEPLVELATTLVGDERPAEIVLSHFPPPPAPNELGGAFNDQLATTAASLDTLHRLRQLVEDRGISSVVSARTSADPIGELVTQAAVVRADIVVIEKEAGGPSAMDAERALYEVGCDVAVVAGRRLSTSRPIVAANVGTTTHHTAALELAARTSLGLGAPVQLVDVDGGRRRPRRAREIGGLLSRLGVPVDVIEGDPAVVAEHAPTWSALLVGLPNSWQTVLTDGSSLRDVHDPLVDTAAATTTVVVVRSRDTHEREGLSRMIRERAEPRTELVSA